MDNDIRIETLKSALMASDISPAEKDALADDLEYAQLINGSPDPVQQGIKRTVISSVRREMLAHQRLKKHESDCAAAAYSANPVAAGMCADTLLYCLTSLRVYDGVDAWDRI